MTRQILFIEGYDIRYPRMPDEANPGYPAWKLALEHELGALADGAILVGHSVGGTILINALAEQAPGRKLAGVFLISAPFVGTGGWPADGFASSPDLGARLPQATPIYLYHGTEDETAPCAHVDLYKQAIPNARVRKLAGRDHQLNDDLSEVAADIRQIV